MDKIIKLVLGALVIFAVGVGVGKFSLPSSKTQTETSTKESETEREVTDRTITRPDGTKETERIVKDVKKDKKESSNTVAIVNKKPDWKVSGLIGYSFKEHVPVYGIDIQRRILGAVSIGAFATTERSVGLSVGYEF